MGTTTVVVFRSAFFAPAASPASFSSPTMETSLLRIPDKSSSVYTFFGLAFSFSDFFAAPPPASFFFCSGCDCVCEEDCCEGCEGSWCDWPTAAATGHSTAREALKIFLHSRSPFFMENLTRENPIRTLRPLPGTVKPNPFSCNPKSACSSQLFPAVGCPRCTPFDTVPDCSASNDFIRNGGTHAHFQGTSRHSGLSRLQEAGGTARRWLRPEMRSVPPCLSGARRYSRDAARRSDDRSRVAPGGSEKTKGPHVQRQLRFRSSPETMAPPLARQAHRRPRRFDARSLPLGDGLAPFAGSGGSRRRFRRAK